MSQSELEERFGFTSALAEGVLEVLRSGNVVVQSLDQPVRESEDGRSPTRAESLVSLLPSPLERLEMDDTRRAQRRLIRQSLHVLDKRERVVLRLYWAGNLTMLQIAAHLGVNESRVSQIHARAISRLRFQLLVKDRSNVLGMRSNNRSTDA